MAIKLKWLSKNLPRTLPVRSSVDIRVRSPVIFQTLSEENNIKYSNQPRLNPKFKDTNRLPRSFANLFSSVFTVYNPFILALNESETVTVKGMITDIGAPILGKRILVVLMTSDGEVVEKVFTDLEGNFVFYEIPQNLSLMAVAIDTTYKYNAVILSKILTIDNGV